MTALLAEAPTGPAAFLAFLDARPDHERWELIDGEAVMQATATITHALIAGNIDRLFNETFDREGSTWISIQNVMADLNAVVQGNMYVPDVMVLDGKSVVPNQNTTSGLIAAVEIVSPSDRRRRGGTVPIIDSKLDRYRQMPSCQVVMLVEQQVPRLRLFVRSGESWSERSVTRLDAEVSIPLLGFRCQLRDIYRRTALGHAPS